MSPAFSYTSGNISNLVAGGNASMADIQGPFTDVRTTLNGGLDEVNVPNLTAAFMTYKVIARGAAQTTNPTNVVTLLVGSVVSANVSNPIVNSIFASASDVALYLDPAIFTANARTTKLRLRYTVYVNSIAPAITYTAGLYPIATYGGGSGAGPFVASVGTVVTGSTVVVATPGSAGATVAVGTDFTFPAAGQYLLGVAPSTTATANSVQHHVAHLEMRQS